VRPRRIPEHFNNCDFFFGRARRRDVSALAYDWYLLQSIRNRIAYAEPGARYDHHDRIVSIGTGRLTISQ